MEKEFKGIDEDDIFIIKAALTHYRKRLLAFKEDERVEMLGYDTIYSDVDNDTKTVDELLKYMIPNRADFGVGKEKKFNLYVAVIASALRQYGADMVELRRVFRDEFPESLLEVVGVDDTQDEVERVLSTYAIFRIRKKASS
jgi:hypothetical protein